MPKPELVIGYDEECRPVQAVCSACGEEMPKGEPRVTTTKEMITWFSSQFYFHVRRKHAEEEPES